MKVEKNIGYYKVGDRFTVVPDIVLNNCEYLLSNVIMDIVIPEGLILHQATLPKGTYNVIDTAWEIGNLTPGQHVVGGFEFEITDDCPLGYEIVFTLVSDSSCDDCFNETEYCINITGFSCCHLTECVINQYLTINTGNVLYVSKEGNNSTAIKGDISKPWADPWAAAAAMLADDVVHIFPGTWTIGDVGSGADFETNSVTGPNLIRAFNQKFHFEVGAKIEVIDTVRVYELFTHTGPEAFTLEITGNGSFEFLESGKLFNINTLGAVNVTFEAESVSNLWYNRIVTEGGYVVHRTKFIGTSLTLSPIFDFGSNSGTTFTFHSDTCIYGVSTGQDANVANGVFKINKGVGLKAGFTIGTLIAYKKSHVGSIFSVEGTCNGNLIDIKIGSLDAYDPFITNGTYATYTIDETTNVNATNGVDTELGMLFRIPAGNTNGNILNIEVGTLSSHHVIVGHQVAGSGVKNEVNVRIGSAVCKANNPLYFNDNGSNVSDELTLHIERGYSATGIIILEGTLKWMSTILSGYLRTAGAGLPVISYQGSNLTRNPLKLNNLKLVNDGTVDVISPITGGNARQFIINNVMTNSTVVNADVTESVGTIVRDALLG